MLEARILGKLTMMKMNKQRAFCVNGSNHQCDKANDSECCGAVVGPYIIEDRRGRAMAVTIARCLESSCP